MAQPKDLPRTQLRVRGLDSLLRSQCRLIDTNASAHGRRERDLAQVNTLAGCWLRLVQRVQQREQVGLQIGISE